MFKELEAQAEKPAHGEPGPEGICDCQCSEPEPADGEAAPAGNRTLAYSQKYWDING
ncbi:MAG: hypothetical protein KAX84_21040 [Burkholderiales bacterium]|nr:hypothetical protein [Burkholderiales bacterium]